MKVNELIMQAAAVLLAQRDPTTFDHDVKVAVHDARKLYNEVLNQSRLNGNSDDKEAFV